MRARDIWAESSASRAVSSRGQVGVVRSGAPKIASGDIRWKGAGTRRNAGVGGHVGTRPGRVRDAGTHTRPAPRALTPGNVPDESGSRPRNVRPTQHGEVEALCRAVLEADSARYARHRAQAVSRVAFGPFCCVVRTFSGSGPSGPVGPGRGGRVRCTPPTGPFESSVRTVAQMGRKPWQGRTSCDNPHRARGRPHQGPRHAHRSEESQLP
jgi:hypothetical protein